MTSQDSDPRLMDLDIATLHQFEKHLRVHVEPVTLGNPEQFVSEEFRLNLAFRLGRASVVQDIRDIIRQKEGV